MDVDSVSIHGLVTGAPQPSVWVGTGDWRVVHTKSRQEKALAEYLEGRGIDHYLPLVRRVRYYGRRKFVVATPLFPGYLFLRGGLEEAYAADRTDRVVRVIPVANQEQLDADLGAIRFALERDAA